MFIIVPLFSVISIISKIYKFGKMSYFVLELESQSLLKIIINKS